MIGQPKDMSGNVYRLTSLDVAEANDVRCCNPIQPLTVAKTLRRGQVWKDPSRFKHYKEMMFHDDISWKLVNITDMDDDIKRLNFIKKDDKNRYKNCDVPEHTQAYKDLILKLDMNKGVLKKVIQELLLNVFTPEMLIRLLDTERIEFIVDSDWMYLKCGDIAYRV